MRFDVIHGWTGGQYSLFRALLGLVLGVELIGLLRGADLLLSSENVSEAGDGWATSLGMLPDTVVATLVGVGILAAAALALGVRDRSAAGFLWVLLTVLVARDPLLTGPGPLAVVLVLAFHVATPTAPWGAWSARGRVDPGGGWTLPTWLYGAAWMVAGGIHFLRGLALLPRRGGSYLVDLVDGPLGRVGPWTQGLLDLPPEAWAAAATIAVVLRLTFLPLALVRRLRPLVWTATGLMLLVETVVLNPFFLDGGLLLLHALLADPSWIRPRRGDENPDRVFYDGHCGLCHGFVRFVLAEDRAAPPLRFAPLQGPSFAAALPADVRDRLPDSVIVLTGTGSVLVRSAAALYLLRALGGVWRLAGEVGRGVPRQLLDVLYDGVARIRLHVFGKAKDSCPLLPPDLRARFDP